MTDVTKPRAEQWRAPHGAGFILCMMLAACFAVGFLVGTLL